MPLVDAYIKCTGIDGSFTIRDFKVPAGCLPHKADTPATSHEVIHEKWSEIYSFSYDLSDEYPNVSITKPVDGASNDLYLLFLQNQARTQQKGKGASDQFINEVCLDMCRWVDVNNDGVVDKFQVFLKYIFKKCRVTSYDISIDFEAEDLPEESITFSFREMYMKYTRPDNPAEFTWDFMKASPGK